MFHSKLRNSLIGPNRSLSGERKELSIQKRLPSIKLRFASHVLIGSTFKNSISNLIESTFAGLIFLKDINERSFP